MNIRQELWFSLSPDVAPGAEPPIFVELCDETGLQLLAFVGSSFTDAKEGDLFYGYHVRTALETGFGRHVRWTRPSTVRLASIEEAGPSSRLLRFEVVEPALSQIA